VLFVLTAATSFESVNGYVLAISEHDLKGSQPGSVDVS